MNPGLWDEEQLSRPPRNSRREAREAVLQMLYSMHFGERTTQEALDDICLPFTGEAGEFIKRLLDTVIKQRQELDQIITENARNWDFNRLFIIDRMLLEIALAEILFFEDIPPKVSINEAIEIGKRFGSDKSGQFINGILDASYLKLKKANRVHKAGRGLLD